MYKNAIIDVRFIFRPRPIENCILTIISISITITKTQLFLYDIYIHKFILFFNFQVTNYTKIIIILDRNWPAFII